MSWDDAAIDNDENPCEVCGGRGWIIVCCDDLCANSDRCIHGDGERVCPECGGSGYWRPNYRDAEG